MKTIRFIYCLFICISCTSQTSQDGTVFKKEGKLVIEKNITNTMYVFENDSIKQTAELSLHNDYEIHFIVVSYNKIRNQDARIAGIAIIKGGDFELDEDSEGNAYPVYEYIYENDCWLAFRIDRETKEKMRIIEADCKLPNQYCPFASVDLLVKQ